MQKHLGEEGLEDVGDRAILAALSISDPSGYDLLKSFADSNGCFWRVWRATQQ